MIALIIIGIVALAGVSICGLVASLANLEMVDKVNDMLPEVLATKSGSTFA
jgi:hypothetical protein